MILESMVSRRVGMRPHAVEGGHWAVGSDGTGWYYGPSPAEALEAWAADYDLPLAAELAGLPQLPEAEPE
jgi:hypothetical protein